VHTTTAGALAPVEGLVEPDPAVPSEAAAVVGVVESEPVVAPPEVGVACVAGELTVGDELWQAVSISAVTVTRARRGGIEVIRIGASLAISAADAATTTDAKPGDA
jgi:hypothetical protein